jgi:nuclear pore complex protein Nup93
MALRSGYGPDAFLGVRHMILTSLYFSRTQDSQGIPQVERDLLQVEQLSQKLKARTARIDSGSQTIAATRLLAQEGLNTRKCVPVPPTLLALKVVCSTVSSQESVTLRMHQQQYLTVDRLTRALQTIELRPTYEDVLPVECSSVDEYLEQMHETTTMAAIQVQDMPQSSCTACMWLSRISLLHLEQHAAAERRCEVWQDAQRDTISAFEEYMDACMMADWATDKRSLFDAALPDAAVPGPAGQTAGSSLTATYAPAQFRTPLTGGLIQPMP